MKKFMALLLAIATTAMVAAFAGAFFANAMFAKNAQMVVAEATATPSANVEPTATPIADATATPIVEATATPIAEVISEQKEDPSQSSWAEFFENSEQKEDPSQSSWAEFFEKAYYNDGSFNAVNVGGEAGRINFTDEDLMAHVGEKITVNVASRSVSVKFENVEHTKYESASVKSPDLSACKKHLALARRHSRAYGDNITIKLTADDITNITTYAAYWYDKTGKLTYGFAVCGCANGAGSGSGSGSAGSSDNGGNHPSDEPTAAPTQEPQPTAKPTNEPLETPRPGTDNTPEAPSETASNIPSHNETENTPAPVANNTPTAPTETASNLPEHNDIPGSSTDTTVSGSIPSHSDLPTEEASESTVSVVADAGSASASADLVVSIASNDAPPAPAEDMVAIISSEAEGSESSSTQEVPDPVVEAVTDASNITAHDNMPTE